MAKPLALYYATIGRPIGSDTCNRTTWRPSIAQSLPPTELPSGQQLHARCMQLSITAGGLLEYCTALGVGNLPMRLTSLHGARSCRGKEGKENKEKNSLFGIASPTTHLGSCHQFPPAFTSIVQHSDTLPVPEITVIRALAHFRRPPNLPGHTWLRGHHEGSLRLGSLWGRSFITILTSRPPVWCPARRAPHPLVYLIQVLAGCAASPLCSSLGYPVHATT